MTSDDKTLQDLLEEMHSGGFTLPNIEKGIPDKVTVNDLQKALDKYARADKDWKDYFKFRYLAVKEHAGDRLYRLAKAILQNNGFYDAVIDSVDSDRPSSKAENFE